LFLVLNNGNNMRKRPIQTASEEYVNDILGGVTNVDNVQKREKLKLRTLYQQIEIFNQIQKDPQGQKCISSKKVDFCNDLLIIVDMQNDFMGHEDGHQYTYGEDNRKAALPTRGSVEMCMCIASMALSVLNDDINNNKNRGAVIVTRDFHTDNHISFDIFGKHCVGSLNDSSGSYIVECLNSALSYRDNLRNQRLFYVFKAFHKYIDSFGAFSYSPYYAKEQNYVNKRILFDRSDIEEKSGLGKKELLDNFTGSFLYLKDDEVSYEKLQNERKNCIEKGDYNASCMAPSLENVLFDKRLQQTALKQVKQFEKPKVFLCGVLGDFCVLDSAITARLSGKFKEIYIIFDLIRSLQDDKKKLVFEKEKWISVCLKYNLKLVLSVSIHFVQGRLPRPLKR